MGGLTFTYLPTGIQEPIYEPTPTLITTDAPMLAPTVQLAPADNDTTNSVYTLILHLLNNMQHMQQIMVHMQ